MRVLIAMDGTRKGVRKTGKGGNYLFLAQKVPVALPERLNISREDRLTVR